MGMNDDQVVDLAEAIIDSSHEDRLAIEDVLLFLRDMLTGKCGKIYDRMDMPTFFEMFEVYRSMRFQVKERFKEEREAQFKVVGYSNRSFDDEYPYINRIRSRNDFTNWSTQKKSKK